MTNLRFRSSVLGIPNHPLSTTRSFFFISLFKLLNSNIIHEWIWVTQCTVPFTNVISCCYCPQDIFSAINVLSFPFTLPSFLWDRHFIHLCLYVSLCLCFFLTLHLFSVSVLLYLFLCFLLNTMAYPIVKEEDTTVCILLFPLSTPRSWLSRVVSSNDNFHSGTFSTINALFLERYLLLRDPTGSNLYYFWLFTQFNSYKEIVTKDTRH